MELETWASPEALLMAAERLQEGGITERSRGLVRPRLRSRPLDPPPRVVGADTGAPAI